MNEHTPAIIAPTGIIFNRGVSFNCLLYFTNKKIPAIIKAKLDQVFAGVLIDALMGSSQRPIGDNSKFSQGLIIVYE